MKSLNNILESIAKPLMPITPWLLRLGLGTSFILHGIGKFPLPPEKMVTWFESMGYMYPEIVTSMVALGEVAAGAGIILGGLSKTDLGNLITRISGGAVAVIMIGAILIAHSDWLITKKLFMSEQIFLFILGLYFAIKGNK
jgi:putative oxidoreductase